MGTSTPLTLGAAVLHGYELAVELWDEKGAVYHIPIKLCKVVPKGPDTSEIKIPTLTAGVDFTLMKCVIAANVNGKWVPVMDFTLQGNPNMKVGQNLTLDSMNVTFT